MFYFAYYSPCGSGREYYYIERLSHSLSVGCKRKFTYHADDLFIGVDHVVYAMERESERDEVTRESKRKGKGSPWNWNFQQQVRKFLFKNTHAHFLSLECEFPHFRPLRKTPLECVFHFTFREISHAHIKC